MAGRGTAPLTLARCVLVTLRTEHVYLPCADDAHAPHVQKQEGPLMRKGGFFLALTFDLALVLCMGLWRSNAPCMLSVVSSRA